MICDDPLNLRSSAVNYTRAPHARHVTEAIHHPPPIPLAPTGPLYVGTGANRWRVLPATIGSLGRDTVRTPGEWIQGFSLICASLRIMLARIDRMGYKSAETSRCTDMQ